MDYYPVRPLIKCNPDDGAWMIAQKADQRKRFKAIICTLKEIEGNNQSNLTKYNDESTLVAKHSKFSKEFILENCKTVDPYKIAVINVSFKDLESSSEEFYEFSSVYKIDATSNRLSLDDFITFIFLVELNLSSNNLKNININPQDFENLQILDLSFNNLCSEDILMLGLLRKLKILILTGNNLRILPTDMAHPYMGEDGKCYPKFNNLEELNIEYNELHSCNEFSVLSGLPKLRILKLAHNNFESIPLLKCITLKNNHTNKQIKKHQFDIEEEEEEELEDYQHSFFNKNIELRIPSTLHEVEEETTNRTTIDTKRSNEFDPKVISDEEKLINEILDEILDKIDLTLNEYNQTEISEETKIINEILNEIFDVIDFQEIETNQNAKLEVESENNYRNESELSNKQESVYDEEIKYIADEIQQNLIIEPEDVEEQYYEERSVNNTQVLTLKENLNTKSPDKEENIRILIQESSNNVDIKDIDQDENVKEIEEETNEKIDKLNNQNNNNNNLPKANLREKDNFEIINSFNQEFATSDNFKDENNESIINQEISNDEITTNSIKIIIEKQNSQIEKHMVKNNENSIKNLLDSTPNQIDNGNKTFTLNEEYNIINYEEKTSENQSMSPSSDDEDHSNHSVVIVNDFMKLHSMSDIIRQLSISSFSENTPKPFPVLEYLDLSFNQIKSEKVLIPVIAWVNLKILSIYNNPISMKKSQKSSFIKVLLENTFKIKVEWLPPILKEKPNPMIKKSKLRIIDTIPNIPLNCRKSSIFLTDLTKMGDSELKLPKMMPLPNILNQYNSKHHKENDLVPITEVNDSDVEIYNDFDENQSKKLVGKNRTFLLRALQYRIDHPITYFERNVDLFVKQSSLQLKKKKTNQGTTKKMKTSEIIQSVLEQRKNSTNQSEISLDKVLSTEFVNENRKNKQESLIALKALKNMQNKYNQVRLESLKKES